MLSIVTVFCVAPNPSNEFNEIYLKKGNIPNISNRFELNLFNTFRSFLYNNDFFPVYYSVNDDERGRFSELIRSHSKSQFSFSTTNKKFVRGNHFHTKKIERFSVIQGKAEIELRVVGKKDKDELLKPKAFVVLNDQNNERNLEKELTKHVKKIS